jgi:hypothetical protein
MYMSTQEQAQDVAPAHSLISAFWFASVLLVAQVDVARILPSTLQPQSQFELFVPPQLSRGNVSRAHTNRIFHIFLVFMVTSFLRLGVSPLTEIGPGPCVPVA